jgi:hypothetical protein
VVGLESCTPKIGQSDFVTREYGWKREEITGEEQEIIEKTK